MKRSFVTKIARLAACAVLLCITNPIRVEALEFVTGAPTGSPGEPTYNPLYPIDVDWFSQQIAGNYYFAATVPNPVSSGSLITIPPTIGVYHFRPGAVKPTDGVVNFVSSAPTNTTVTDSFFPFPMSVSWFPGSIAGQYFFTVVGSSDPVLNGTEVVTSNIRLYRFVPNNMVPTSGVVEFIATAPMQDDQFFLAPNAVDWLPYKLGSNYYFSVVGFTSSGTAQLPEVRVYSFNPWSDSIEYVGAAACGLPNCTDLPFGGEGAFAVDWVHTPVNGNAIFAVGGHNNGATANQEVRVYCFIPGQGPDVQSRVQLLATAPTTASADRMIDAALAVRWLTVNDTYYLAVGVLEDAQQLNNIKNRSVRIYQFVPNKSDIRKSTLQLVTTAPTCQECTLLEQQDAFLHAAVSLDWLTKDCNYYLVVAEADVTECGMAPGGAPCPGQGTEAHQRIRLYQFDPSKKSLKFLGGAWPNQEELGSQFNSALWPSAVDWFPDSIAKGCYLVSGLSSIECEGTLSVLSDLVRVYFFRPSCEFSQLSYRIQE